MKITDSYIEIKNRYNEIFQKFSAKERVEKVDEIHSLKKEIDSIEGKIINGIINYSIDYDRCYNELKRNDLHFFLKDSVAISRFLMNQGIRSTIGFDQEKRDKTLNTFKELCEKVWEDFIITKEEREELNSFCRNNLIDKTQQFLIEQEVSRRYNNEFDLIKIVEYYFLNENLSDEEIKNVLIKEYKKDVDLERIKFITTQIDSEIVKDLDIEDGESKLIKTLKWNDRYSIYIIIVSGNLTSGFEFEIGFKEGEKDSFKIMISRDLYKKIDRSRLIDIITDGICYHLNSNDNGLFQLKFFLEMKPNIRERVENLI